jgi:hypothetical protein
MLGSEPPRYSRVQGDDHDDITDGDDHYGTGRFADASDSPAGSANWIPWSRPAVVVPACVALHRSGACVVTVLIVRGSPGRHTWA